MRKYLRALIGISFFVVTEASRPKWLSHVDRPKIERLMELARKRHNEAVKLSLESYDVRRPTSLTDEQLEKEKSIIENIKLDTYQINAHGKLPDFRDELGDCPVFVTKKETPLFSADECKDVVQMAENYFETQDGMATMESGQYYIQGFWLKDDPAIKEWFIEKCQTRLFPLLKKQFPDFVDSIEDLVVDSAYLFKYTAQPGLRTEIHTDGGCLSLTLSLNPKSEYEGGGTWVEGLTGDDPSQGETIEMDVGQCTVRPGGIRHCGNPLTGGTRYIIGAFSMNTKKVEHVRQLMGNCPKRDSPTTIKEALECAIAINPEFEGPYPALTNIYECQGEKEKAKQVVEDCLRLANPKSMSASYYLGSMHYKEGKYEEALQCMLNCLSVDGADGDALQTLAQCYANMGNKKEEQQTYLRTVQAPGVSNRVLHQAYCNLGTMHEGEDMEIEYYEKSLQAEPGNVSAMHSLGSAYASRREWDKAISVFKEILKGEAAKGESQFEYLTLLYRSATGKLRDENKATSRGEIMKQLSATMGAQNMEQLMAFQSKR